jgi:glycosyltransferase involved in cell wall biosynthesis
MAYARDLSTALRDMGIEVHFAAPTPRDASWLREHGIIHVATDQDDDPVERARLLLRHVETSAIDGVINNDNAFVQSIAPALRCPFISVGHLGKRSIATLACHQPQWSDYVVAISDEMQRLFVHKFAVPFTRCPIVFTGVHDPGCPRDYSQSEPGTLRMIFTGGYNRETKGADLVADAVRRGGDRWRHMKLDWFGVVPPGMARELAKHPSVTLHGHVPRPQLLAAMRGADVLLLPSRHEGCPLTMIEAMSLGVVPIASDGIGAMRWIATSGKDGFICHLDRWPAQMLETANFLQQHPQALMALKQRARETYAAGFTNARVAARLLDLLSAPTVNRTWPATDFEVLRWHRPLRPDGLKSPLPDRVFYRLGVLRKAGRLRLRAPAAAST